MKRVSAFLFTVIFLLGVLPATASASPKDLKAATADELQGLSPSDKRVKKEINKAIENIEKSLTSAYWETDWTLGGDGFKVFDAEKRAAKSLMKISKRKGVSQQIKQAARDAGTQLVSADAMLAERAILLAVENADAAGCRKGSKARKCKKILKEIEKAKSAYKKASARQSRTKPDKAIDLYKKAWRHAHKAMGMVPEADDMDGDGVPDDADNCPETPNAGQADADSDGTGDACDGCPADPNKVAAGVCGCGVADTDSDGDGIADCNDNCPDLANPGQEDCNNDGTGDVCDAINPNADDSICDGIDQNCNGIADDGYVATATGCGMGVCDATGSMTCANGQLVDTCLAGQSTGTDTDCDGLDQNCNGVADDGYVQVATSCGIGACAAGGQTSCVGGSVVDDCSPGDPATEICDDLDNDCDGSVDEGCITCFDIPAGDPGVCSGSGACIGDDVCDCNPGYHGEDCSTAFKCFHVDADYASVCSGHGDCVGEDLCRCDPGYHGSLCQVTGTVTCSGLGTDDPEVCSGNGICVSNEACKCFPGFVGDNCQVQFQGECYGISALDPEVCDGLGACVGPDECRCDPHATWNAETLTCEPGWKCEGYFPDDGACSDLGTCVATDICVCDAGYKGSFCQWPFDSETECDERLGSDPLVCNGRGACLTDDLCSCEDGFHGDYCQFVVKCFEIDMFSPDVCSGHGMCHPEMSVGDCICASGWDGDECEINVGSGPSDECDGPWMGQACGVSDVGQCSLGTIVCQDDAIVCDGSIDPVGEICDGLDNDCDGDTDEECE